MTDTPDSVLRKIRGLLAQAEDDGATRQEAETFTAKAAELLAKYGIDRAMLAADDPTTDRVADRIITVAPPYAMGKLNLLYSIAEALGAEGVRRRSKTPGTEELHLFGMESDLERVEVLWTSLLVQCLRFQAVDFDRDPAAWRQPRKWKRDYIEGFRARVFARLREAEQRAKQQAEAQHTGDGPSVELVLVDRRQLVQQRMSETYPNRRASTSRRAVGSGYQRGQAAGNRADLGGTRVTGGGGAAISRQ